MLCVYATSGNDIFFIVYVTSGNEIFFIVYVTSGYKIFFIVYVTSLWSPDNCFCRHVTFGFVKSVRDMTFGCVYVLRTNGPCPLATLAAQPQSSNRCQPPTPTHPKHQVSHHNERAQRLEAAAAAVGDSELRMQRHVDSVSGEISRLEAELLAERRSLHAAEIQAQTHATHHAHASTAFMA